MTSALTKKIALVSEIVTPYRIPLFNVLGQELGNDFKVFFMGASCKGKYWRIPYEKMNFEYKILKGLDLLRFWPGPDPCFWNFDMVNKLENFNPDIVIISGYSNLSSFLALEYAKSHGKKVFLWSESTISAKRSYHPLVEKIKKNFLKKCDGFIVSGQPAEDYMRSYPITGPVYWAPPAVDRKLFAEGYQRYKDQKDKLKEEFQKKYHLPSFNLLFAGRFSAEKGISRALELMRRLKEKNIGAGLVLVGEGPLRAQCEKWVREKGIENILFTGFKQPEELPYYFAVSDLLIVPSEWEPWGMILNEAMISGLPVLCGPLVESHKDLIISGKTGYVCANYEEYEMKIEDLMKDRGRLKVMSEECRKHIESYSPEKMAEGFLKAID